MGALWNAGISPQKPFSRLKTHIFLCANQKYFLGPIYQKYFLGSTNDLPSIWTIFFNVPCQFFAKIINMSVYN